MKRRTLIASIGAVAGTTLGAAAYSSVTMDRGAEITVTDDSGALITLGEIGEGEYTTTTNGELGISISSLNKNAEFVIGDENAPNTGGVFSVTNAYSSTKDLTFSYAFTGTPDDGTVTFKFWKEDSANAGSYIVADTADANSPGTFSLAGTDTASETAYVTLVLNTGSKGSTITDLSGDLTIEST